jgi:hypothetical protein
MHRRTGQTSTRTDTRKSEVEMTKELRRPELSPKHSGEGDPVPLGVCVRAGLKRRLERIAGREDRSLGYIVDEVLRWAVNEYSGAGSLRNLLASETDFSDEADKTAERELDQVQA